MFDINANTLRAWERRYGIFEPVRSEGGQRGYGVDSLELIREMVDQIRSGVSPAAAAEFIRNRKNSLSGGRKYETWKQRFQKAVELMQPADIVHICRKAEDAIGYQAMVEKVVFPAMVLLGERWHDNIGTIAEEHCVSLGVRTCLSQRYLRTSNSRRSIPSITLACTPGELHDIPLLHLANLLADSGHARPVVLAAGLPLSETLFSAERSKSQILLLSATMPVSSTMIREWIRELQQTGWEQKCILAGGAFLNSRVFSESRVRAAAGDYDQTLSLIRDMIGTV